MKDVRQFLKGAGAAALLVAGLATTPASAVGIGQARVESFLGEPLRVRVTLSFAPGENITNACVRIASPPGVESPFIPDLARARFQMIEGPRGAELLITTTRPYTDPILVFPLKVGCGEGGVYREITLLIDPPGMAAPTRAATAAPPPPPATTPRRVTRVAPTPTPRVAPVDVEGGEWYVDRGETLTGIIIESGLDGGDRKRRLELIDEVVAANPNVFRGRGPDYLPAGATLTLPGWNGSKAKGGTPVLAETEEAQAAPTEPEAKPETEPAAKDEEFRLELTGERPEGQIVTPEMKAIEEELAKINAASEEERKLNTELQERLLQLRQQAAELQLVAERMARESEQLATQEGAQATPEPAAAAPAESADAPAPSAPVSVAAPAGLPPPTPQAEPVAPAAMAEPSLMDWINDNLLLVAGAIFVVLIFFAFLVRRGGSTSDEGPTLDELIAQKELEREAQLREIEEAAQAVHQDMIDASEAHAATQDEARFVAVAEATPERVEAEDQDLIADADAGHYIFSVEEVDSLLEQAEVLLLFGEPEKAILMIEEYLDGPGRDSTEPRPWLKLFHLLRSEERRSEFEERASAFKRRFNIEKPSWATYSPDGFMGEGVGLEEGCPHIAQRIENIWDRPGKALGYLDALLVDDRDGERVGFPAMIAEDLLLLRDLAARRALVEDELHASG
jgi:hypothetical protein